MRKRKMHDFCFSIPYGLILVVGGTIAYVKKGSMASLGGGVALDCFSFLSGYLSLKALEKRKSSYMTLLIETGTLTIVALARCQLWRVDPYEDLASLEETKTSLFQRLKRDNNYFHLPPLAFTAIGPDPCKNMKMFPWPPVIKPKLRQEDDDQILDQDSQEDEFYRPNPEDVTSTMQGESSSKPRPSPIQNPSPLPRPSSTRPSSMFHMDEDLDIDLVLSQYQAPCPDPPPESFQPKRYDPDNWPHFSDEPEDLNAWPQHDPDPSLEDLNTSPSHSPIRKH